MIKGWGYALRTSIPFRYAKSLRSRRWRCAWRDVEAIDVEVGNLALRQMMVMRWKPGMTMNFAVSEAMKIVPRICAARHERDVFLYIYQASVRN
ncbi:hypothetical protein BBB56_01090 [Candidatus Pantoea deserta]|uniref:Uncharacterized protein n=1 Tax=Candidatus Pantoea deserta TaxID=1869313 RepID=A0A3N4PAR4_9GAMM|nr:hypothetical protein [Pantoea deserta]RPE04468.1 hypothetical protein BBB56_01090 [Pantoea deserta]